MNWIHIVFYHYIIEEILFLTQKKKPQKKKNSTQFVFAWYSIVSCNLFAKCKTKDIVFDTF